MKDGRRHFVGDKVKLTQHLITNGLGGKRVHAVTFPTREQIIVSTDTGSVELFSIEA